MRKYLRNLSMWAGMFSAAAIVETVGLREWAKNPLFTLAVFTVAVTVNALLQDD